MAGRPEKPIDWDLVDKYIMAGCLGTEIAPHFDVHVNTLYDRLLEKYNCNFTEYSRIKRCQGLSLIRYKQFEKALDGDNTMLVWLGKNCLKQRENPESENTEMEEKKLETALNLLKFLQNKTQSALNISEINSNDETKS
jgi:hypothetical protein